MVLSQPPSRDTVPLKSFYDRAYVSVPVFWKCEMYEFQRNLPRVSFYLPYLGYVPVRKNNVADPNPIVLQDLNPGKKTVSYRYGVRSRNGYR
jgi:hypothetical protein